jgi:ABC-type Fe3+-hydroxamate transport system substrate-binding protein
LEAVILKVYTPATVVDALVEAVSVKVAVPDVASKHPELAVHVTPVGPVPVKVGATVVPVGLARLT